jgi:hypothetical protein
MADKRFASSCYKVLILSICLGLSLGCTNSLFVESQEVTQGEIEHFKIGMNKQQVFDVARGEGVRAITPILNAASSVDYSNVSALESPGNGRSLELSYSQYQKVIFTFGDCKVAGARLLGDSNDSWKDFIGRTPDELVASIRTAMTGNHVLSAREVISSENQAWFSIDQKHNEGMGTLGAYDVWSFSLSTTKPAGAEFVIYFSEGSVARISYRRPRIRVD